MKLVSARKQGEFSFLRGDKVIARFVDSVFERVWCLSTSDQQCRESGHVACKGRGNEEDTLRGIVSARKQGATISTVPL